MNYAFTYLYLLSFVSSLVVTILMVVLLPRHAYKIPLVMAGGSATIWALSDFMSNLATTGRQVEMLHMVAAPYWAVLPFLFLHASLLYSGRLKRIGSSIIEGVLALPAFACIALEWGGYLYSDFVPPSPEVPWFYFTVSPLETGVMLYSLSYFFATGWLLTHMSADMTEEQLRFNRHMVFRYLLPLAILALLSNGGLAMLDVHPPLVASAIIGAFTVLVGVGALRASFFQPVARMLVSLDRREEVLAAMPFGVAIVPPACTDLLYASPTFHQLVGMEVEGLLEACARACMGDCEESIELELSDFPRAGCALEVRGSPIFCEGEPAVMLVLHDASDQLATRRELVRNRAELEEARRLEVIGRLSTNIVHDFNNLLSVIQLGTHTASVVAHDPEVQSALEEVFQAVDVGRSLNRKLMLHSRDKSAYEPALIDLNALVVHVAPLLRGVVSSQVTVQVHPAAGAAPTVLDQVLFEQVLINLVRNADHAMPDGGTVTVRVLDDPAMDELHVVVEDTGEGMSAEVLARATEPFFSTKGDAGHGIGLASVRSTLERSGGKMLIRSRTGYGTVFTLCLPRAARDVDVSPSEGRQTDLLESDAAHELV